MYSPVVRTGIYEWCDENCLSNNSTRTIENEIHFTLTVVTAQVGRAPVVIALDGVGAVDRGILVGALVVRAERLAALLFLALAAVALHVFGVLDQRVTVGAFHGVAVLLLI